MKITHNTTSSTFLTAFAVMVLLSCSKSLSTTNTGNNGGDGSTIVTPPVTTAKTDVSMWLTTPDQAHLLEKQNVSLLFNTTTNTNTTINVDSTQTYQTIDGFGFALTGGSAQVINAMPTTQSNALIKELFATDSTAINISYIRITIGASDMSASPFTYDDAGPDVNLQNFSISMETDLIPVLKKIITLNPNIKILACPWSAPAWMKNNNSLYGGSLLPQYYTTYANYFVKYIDAMNAQGIKIDAITPQNEPLNPSNNPAMVMQDTAETKFIGSYLGPAFQAAGITTKIICYDHNCDHPEYPEYVLSNATANQYVDGSAFHLYAGDISAMSSVHNTYPAKNLYFTEQATFSGGTFSGDLNWHITNVIVGATRNWSRNALEWNLASDINYGPHTSGGCTTCQGAVTINGSTFTRNVSYYIVAHASKFVKPGAVRISSDASSSFPNVAFKNPDGSKVLIVLNNSSNGQSFNIQYKSKLVTSTLNGGAVATYTWK